MPTQRMDDGRTARAVERRAKRVLQQTAADVLHRPGTRLPFTVAGCLVTSRQQAPLSQVDLSGRQAWARGRRALSRGCYDNEPCFLFMR